MNKGHKRHSYEERIDLAGEYRWGDAGQLILLIVFIVGTALDLLFLKITLFFYMPVSLFFRILVALPVLIISFIIVSWFYYIVNVTDCFWYLDYNNLILLLYIPF